MAACVDEELPGSGTVLKDGEISLQWIATNMGRQVSRGTDYKTSAERELKDVHVFLFDANGDYLQPGNGGNDAYQGYRHLTGGSSNWVLQTKMFGDQTAAAKATVYVLANMPEGTFTDLVDNHPGNVNKLSDLEALEVKLPRFTTDIPETGLPMVLRLDEVNLSSRAESKVVALQLRSMMARIDLNFTMNPLQAGDDASLPSLTFSKVSVGNFPNGGTVKPQLVLMDGNETPIEDAVTKEGEYGLLDGITEVTSNASLKGKVLSDNVDQSMTLYMFEHSRQAKDLTYPEGIAETEKQRYKNLRAADDAAYVEIEGEYRTQNGLMYHVAYRLYVGADPVADFTIRPNRQYVNDITVTGITVNDRELGEDGTVTGGEALLDTRVNVDNDPVFIEMLRERMFDAHFNVTPMDIYLFNTEAAKSVKVEILNEDGELAGPNEMTWIRMEPYSVASASSDAGKYIWDKENSYGDGGHPGANQFAARFAGDGKRKYFTTTLMDDELNQNESSRTYTVTQPEERIYFYMDENVPDETIYNIDHLDLRNPSESQYPKDVPSRSARIRITYTPADGSAPTVREAVFTQAGMRVVYFNKFGTGGEYSSANRQNYWFYIEEHEEYLAHYDGKNEYTATYDGMKWGLSGVETDLGAPTDGRWYEYMSWGWYNTQEIMENFRSQTGMNLPEESRWRGHEMTLNELPSGAAEYCYNKNKRSASGNHEVADVEWFLPTISEIEFAIDRYYLDIPVFQGNFYWSSNPAAWGSNSWSPGVGTGNNGEDPAKARATKAAWYNEDTGKFEHVPSAANEHYPTYDNGKEGGSASRGEEFRVRAIYVPKRIQNALDVSHN